MDTAPEPVQQEQPQEVSQGDSFKEGITQGVSFGFKDEIVASTDAGKAFLADSMSDAVEHSMGGGENPQYSVGEAYNRRKAYEEFGNVINDFNPDFVFYVGTIKNKISINFCIKNKIKYLYLPLTNEYYCIKHYAGVENKPCYTAFSLRNSH